MVPKVAIIGAGPAGLTLARLLSISPHPLSLVVFEQDSSASSRTSRGGTLDLHDGTGIAALDAAGLMEKFKKKARYEGEALVIGDKHGNRQLEMKGDEEDFKDMANARPEIDREVLKDILLESIPKKIIRWGHRVRSVGPDGIILFEHGAEGPFDLIVGADGAWSKVSLLLTDVRPAFSGIGGFEMHIYDPTNSHPKVSDMIGRGSYFAFSGGQGLSGQRLGDDSIITYAWGQYPETYPKELVTECGGDGIKLKGKLKELFNSWNPEFLEWIEVADAKDIRPWPLYELPVGHSWAHKKGFTLIGDSAHQMTPFAGEGVNAAMKDALELARAIGDVLKNGGDIDFAVKSYEKESFFRNEEVQADTMQNKTLIFREDAPIGFLERMQEQMGGPPP